MIDFSYLSKVLSSKRSGRTAPKFLGYSRKRSVCQHCGKEGLSKGYVYQMSDGSTKCVGSSCAKKFKQYHSDYESVYDDLLEKYPNYEKEIKLFKQRDPSGNLKYLRWEVKILDSKKALENEIADVVDLFHRYSSNLEKKDINSYPSSEFTDLRDTLFKIKEDREAKKAKAKERYKLPDQDGAETIYDGERFSAVLIKTKEASSSFGRGTQWCITMGMSNYWEDYENRNNVFFFIMDKKTISEFEGKNLKENPPPKLYKIAVQFERSSDNGIREITFWNSNDQVTKYSDIEEYVGESEFEPLVKAMANVAKKYPQNPIVKLNNGNATVEDCKSIYQDAINFNDIEKKINLLSELIKYSKTPNSIRNSCLKKLIKISNNIENISQATSSIDQDKWSDYLHKYPNSIVNDKDVYTARENVRRIYSVISNSLENAVSSGLIDKKIIEILIGTNKALDKAIAGNAKDISEESQLELLDSDEEEVLERLAGSSRRKNILSKLYSTKQTKYFYDSGVTCNVLKNHYAPKEILSKAVDDAIEVLKDDKIIELGSKEENAIKKAKCVVSSSQSRPELTRKIVAQCDSRSIEERKDSYSNIKADLCSSAISGMMNARYNNPKFKKQTEGLIQRIISSKSGELGKIAISNSLRYSDQASSLPYYLKLKNDASAKVRASVASAEQAPVFFSIIKDEDPEVRWAASKRYNYTSVCDDSGNIFYNNYTATEDQAKKARELQTNGIILLLNDPVFKVRDSVVKKFGAYFPYQQFESNRLIEEIRYLINKLEKKSSESGLNAEDESFLNSLNKALEQISKVVEASSATSETSEKEKRERFLKSMVDKIRREA